MYRYTHIARLLHFRLSTPLLNSQYTFKKKNHAPNIKKSNQSYELFFYPFNLTASPKPREDSL